ncbi:organomercurial lyase [Amycolatopsis jejuensis]|uniref:organomercurial lyase n=1 Tax=Amycolatopsis jejuensis TaxID=330084 RepID=UPI0005251689|nr:organomercurial lyase [Amycolatopsis jejuensis]
MSSDDDLAWDEDVRLAVYHAFATRGRPPTAPELANAAHGSLAVAKQALHRMADPRWLWLDECEHVALAAPFAAVPLGFAVMGEHTMWWGGCAWDSFAIPHVVATEPEVLVATRCPGCGEPSALVVRRDEPPRGGQLAYFPASPDRLEKDRRGQRLFCGESCVDGPGTVLGLETLWYLAKDWYTGCLEPGYRPRGPAEAAQYFAASGYPGVFEQV